MVEIIVYVVIILGIAMNANDINELKGKNEELEERIKYLEEKINE